MRTFHPIYNPEMALRVVARLRREYPDVHLVMAGAADTSLDGVKRMAEGDGLTAHVSFAGFLDQAAKIQVAGQQDIYLNTNRIDNMPVTVIEMAALGLPVVATRVGGLPDLVTDGVNGLLTPDDNDQAMADAVKRLLSEPGLAERLALAGRALAESCSWEKVRARWEEMFNELYS
jgi:glycosyltransferase involved in cell wall biosynthesis